ncbi:MAG: FtsX-like permease family protein [Alphaproteobacteria bacterium]
MTSFIKKFWTRRLDLPLASDPSSRFLPWIIAFTVFLATLALALMLAIAGVIDQWETDLEGTITVEIPATTPERAAQQAEMAAAALVLLEEIPGIDKAEPLSAEKVMALLEPWLGRAGLVDELPLPMLIDVTLDDARALDLTALQIRLHEISPGITLDDHGIWFGRLIRAARAAGALAFVIFALVQTAAVLVVVFATRTALDVHRDVIDLMHLMGATDSYIADQFQHHALTLGAKGGLIGLGVALVALVALQFGVSVSGAAFMPALSLEPPHWLLLATLPLVSAGTAMISARLTVRRALARLP